MTALVSRPGTRALGWGLAGIILLVLAGALVLLPFNLAVMTPTRIGAYAFAVVAVVVYAGVGGLIAARVPGNPIGWLLCLLGLALAASLFLEQYGLRGLATAPGSLPAVRQIAALGTSATLLAIAPLIMLVLLFPDGRLPSRRWRPVLWGAIAVAVVAGFGELLQRGTVITGGLTNGLGADPAANGQDSGRAQTFVVEHQGERLGALRISSSPREPLTPAGERLVRDVAAQAGLVLRNVALIEDLRASRQRLVAAADEARRRLERNLHDGAQQKLVALRITLGLARQVAGNSPQETDELLAQTEREAQDALEELRDLARGIYPPLLADLGLAAALEAQARKAAVPVTVDAPGLDRYSQEIEAAVYFCVLEALQNVAKYAQAQRARVTLGHDDGALTFTVEDDGRGFDQAATVMGTGVQGMSDRLAALDGTLEVVSAPGAGTRVTGRVSAAG